jgi:hypothetical protein
VEGLKQLHRGSVAWTAYLQSEWLPVVQAGYSPPIAQGFRLFLGAPNVTGPVNQSLEKELAEGKAEALDSHPALPERIRALRDLAVSDPRLGSDDAPAISLFNGLQKAEDALAASALNQPVRPVAWEKVLEQVWIPSWRKQVEDQKEALSGVTVDNLADLLSSGLLRKRLKNPSGVWPTTEQRGQMAVALAGCALALLLLDKEWTFHTLPGEMYCEKNGERLQPFTTARMLATGELPPEKWRESCIRLEIAGLSLEPRGAAAANMAG